jgi:uncharacterized membrane protein
MSKILYAGDSAIMVVLGLEGTEVYSLMDQIWDAGKNLQAALETSGHQVTRMLSHDAFYRLPETAEKMAEYDVLILSDIGHDTVILYPGDRRNAIPMGPNRVKEIVKFIQNGGGLAYIGGYFTYQGHNGQGRWYNSALAKILPVEILPLPDDRIETPEGVQPSFVSTTHPILKGLPLNEFPIFMGYNQTKARPGADLLGVIGEEADPFLACGEVGKGRIMAITSDAAPHWGSDFVRWPYFTQFWNQAMRWLSKES